MQQAKMTLQELMDAAEARLVELNYAPQTIYVFRCYWRDLLSYAEEKNEKYFSVELGEKYLLERRGIDVLADESTLGLPRWRIRPYKRAIYLLAEFKRAVLFLESGRWSAPRFRHALLPYWSITLLWREAAIIAKAP